MGHARVLIVVMALAVLGAGAGGTWYFFQRNADAPGPVSLAEAVASASTPAAPSTTPSGSSATSATPAISPAASANTSEDGLTGTWAVDAPNSFVGYRVREQLALVGATTAVGRTSDVKGSLEFDGSAVTAVEVEANLRTLTSDDNRRDGQLRQQALETNRYPMATFTLTEAIAIAEVPAESTPLALTAVGELTLHGVTREVELALEGVLANSTLVVVGSLEVVFADYGIARPRSTLVLSVEDRGVMEFQLTFRRA